jgi:hypothetical protein
MAAQGSRCDDIAALTTSLSRSSRRSLSHLVALFRETGSAAPILLLSDVNPS